MKGQRLYKIEKLRSHTAIGQLFAPGEAVDKSLAFPLRAVWRESSCRPDSTTCPRFLIMVPKRRLRHAVDRVLMRRRIREAYRLNRDLLPADRPVEIAFIYVDNDTGAYAAVERSMRRLLGRIAQSLNTPVSES